ncbi:Hypothetical predicted protein [Paramuricea clavata]|uniref:Uncharacterized protein n=1 Tax=Paramuricea clavata TaxID=317549 RepID=A0A6S7IJ24_PARCT|nr:Hypothetical predicted protein [Paramuricea clavata]
MINRHPVCQIDNSQIDGNGTISIVSQAATFYAVRVTMPTAGVWNFSIIAFGPFTFQVTAQSTLAFATVFEKEEYSSAFGKMLVPIPGNPIKGHDKRADLLNHYDEATKDLDPSMAWHIGMDGPNVNLAFEKKLRESREEFNLTLRATACKN